ISQPEMQTRTRRAPQRDKSPAGRYGIDAPYLLLFSALIATVNVINSATLRTWSPLIGAGAVLACVGCGLHTSLRGKFLVWSELLEQLHLRGDERILDLGCGRGAVLLAAARGLQDGRAYGVDIWKRSDQSGNSIAATLRNAEVEGVTER